MYAYPQHQLSKKKKDGYGDAPEIVERNSLLGAPCGKVVLHPMLKK
jgi:hypothetical protein